MQVREYESASAATGDSKNRQGEGRRNIEKDSVNMSCALSVSFHHLCGSAYEGGVTHGASQREPLRQRMYHVRLDPKLAGQRVVR